MCLKRLAVSPTLKRNMEWHVLLYNLYCTKAQKGERRDWQGPSIVKDMSSNRQQKVLSVIFIGFSL